MRKIEISKVTGMLLTSSAVCIVYAFCVFILVVINHYGAYVTRQEADAQAYANVKLSASIDDKILAWEKAKRCN